MKNKLMTHVVAGYPNPAKCLELLLGMQQAGVYAIEIQIPFTDPGADGPTIMHANDVALANNMTVAACFELIHKARKQGLDTPVYVMSYANKLFRYGFKEFCSEAQRCDVQGLIIPDLPFDSEEYTELSGCCDNANIELVPVLSPGIALVRLKGYDLAHKELIYVTSTRGITGKELTLHHELANIIAYIRSASKAEIALGFGITKLSHVQQALDVADIAVIGSRIIRIVDEQGAVATQILIKKLISA